MKNKNTFWLAMFTVFFLSMILAFSITTNNVLSAQTSSSPSSTTKNQSQIMSDHVYTTQRKDNSLYDLQQNVTLPAGKDMTYVDVTHDGKIVAATSSVDNQTFIFNGTNGKLIEKIKVGDIPKGVKITPDKKYAFVANELPGSVSIISLGDLKVIKEVKVGPIPHNIVISPDGSKAYVTIQGGDKVVIMDTGTFEKKGEIQDSKGPHNLDITNDGKLLFVKKLMSSSLIKIGILPLGPSKGVIVIYCGVLHYCF